MMLKILPMVFLFSAPFSTTYECCKDDFCSPPQIRPRHLYLYIDQEISLPKTETGCFCKENPRNYVLCYGRISCQGIPRRLNITVPAFRIATSAFKIIKKEDFARYIILQKLEIENNDNLETIEEYSFKQLVKLQNMSISHNFNLKYLKSKTFIGLANLKELYLSSNGFNSVLDFSEALSPRYLPKLNELVLRDNNFATITAADFAPMENSSLSSLNLAQSRIEFIDEDSLVIFKDLKELRIGNNQIDIKNLTNLIIAVTKAKISLKFLNLYKIGLKKAYAKELLEAIGNASVECLSLAGNLFEFISNDTFPEMRNIKLLDLRDVSAVDISEGAFTSLRSLKTLLLADNKFDYVPLGVKIENLTYLDMKLNSKYHFSTSYFTLHNFTFANMTRLKVLDLSFNTIQTLYRGTFSGLLQLKILSLKKCDLIFIGEGTFLPLKSLIFLDIQENRFSLSSFKLIETDVFKGLENLNVLLLGNNNISFVNNYTFSSLKSLLHLSLNDNKLLHLEYQDIQFMTKLNILNLQRNYLSSWNKRLFLNQSNLTSVYLGSNKISNLTRAMLDDFENLTLLDLGYNNFICDCDLFRIARKQFVNDIRSNLVKNMKTGNARCFPSDELIVEFVADDKNNKECVTDPALIIATSAITLLTVIVIVLVSYYYRWHLRYYVFLTRLHLIRRGKSRPWRDKMGDSNYEYDAFVSYSNEDSNFVIRLVSMLENYEPFLKLCVYERDFRIGSIISESILENVTKSRKVLLVISDSYVKSQWCQWETHIAQHCSLFFKDKSGDFVTDSLILIKLGPVNDKYLTPTLKYLLKTRIYLQWDIDESKQRVFWTKLRDNLACGRREEPVFTLTHL